MSWHTYKGHYDPADFIVPPELEKGRSQRVQCYIQSAHYRLLNTLARSGHFPFEERNDVIRWCIMFGLQYLDTLEPGTTRSIMSQANIINNHLKNEMENQRFLEVIQNLKRTVSDAVSRGDEDQARDDVAYAWREIEKMPEEPDRALRWKCKYTDTLRENFRRYLPEGVDRGKG